MSKLAVIAFGGNALLKGNQKGTIDEQEENVYNACSNLVDLIKQDYNLIIGHGNGPQVGNVLLQHEAGSKVFGVPKMPMDVCVAETQGFIGYMIEQQLRNVLKKENVEKDILSFITQVLVDQNDKAFDQPTKPVGPYYSENDAEELIEERGWKFKEDPAGRGWRRVVASPKPIEVNNWQTVQKLALEGNIVVAAGGGGIPVYIKPDGSLMGIDAVIDKDLASAHLAVKAAADEFYILTDVPNVYINFNKPDQKKLERISVDEAEKYLAEGQFTEGSMAPKVRACIHFVKNSKGEAVITDGKSLSGEESGTIIYK